MANANDVTGNNASADANTSESKNTKPIKYPQLFYSPDYQQLFNKEIEEMTLELLQTAELILSTYDYKTIGYLNDNSPILSYDNFGKLVSRTEKDSVQILSHQVNPAVADKTYSILETTISPIKESICVRPNSNYSSLIQNFGHHGTTTGPNIIKYRPGYRPNGDAYYDLELNVTDVDGVIGYNIYMIEEVE